MSGLAPGKCPRRFTGDTCRRWGRTEGEAVPDFAPMDLVVLADEEGNSVRITVLGPEPTWSAGLAAEIVVETPFVSGRTDLILYDWKLQAWAVALDKLDAGEDIAWMAMSNGPSVFIR